MITKIITKFVSITFTLLSLTCLGANHFKIDTNKSVIKWRATKKFGSTHSGNISLYDGNIYFDSKGNIIQSNITVNMQSLKINHPQGNLGKKLLRTLGSKDFFDYRKHKYATFHLTSSSKINSSGNTHQVIGQLTIKNIKKEIKVFDLFIEHDKIEGSFSFNRKEFNLIFGSGSFFENLGDQIINDEIKVQFSLSMSGKIVEIDTNKSYLQWTAESMKQNKYSGKIKFKQGGLALNQNGKLNGGFAILDMNSIKVEVFPKNKNLSWIYDEILGHAILDIKNFQVAKILIKKVTPIKQFNDKTYYKVNAFLKIKNSEKIIEDILLKQSKDSSFSSNLNIDRTNWRIFKYSPTHDKKNKNNLIKNSVKIALRVYTKEHNQN